MYKKGDKLASENGKKGKPGKHKKTEQWEELAESIVTKHAATFNSIMTNLGENDPELFVKIYKDILNYFKPKISYNINQETKELPEAVQFIVKKK